MVTYEEAKKIALETALGDRINEASESKTAYIFDDNRAEYDGGLPVVIVKKTGVVRPWFPYIQAMTQSDFESIHKIEF